MPPAERIATFDNAARCGWRNRCTSSFQHGLRAIGKAAAEKPGGRVTAQPFKAVYEKDMAWLGKAAADYAKGDPSGVFILVVGPGPKSWKNSPSRRSRRMCWSSCPILRTPFQGPYKQLTYKPMVELVHYLQANGFQVYITSGGGRDFMRGSLRGDLQHPAHP